MSKRYQVVTLGCRTNQYESQAYQDQLAKMGYQKAEKGQEADICIVNTCTVTESADGSSRHAIRRLKRESPEAQIVVTGCAVENPKAKKEFEAIEGVSKIVDNLKKEELIQKLFPEDEVPEFKIERFEAHTRAFIKVQDGCNSFCTYCIIPYVRGRSRSKTLTEVVKEAKTLIQNGFKEIVLTGINIGDFDGAEEKKRLSDLVKAVDALEGLKRLRVSSIDPDEVEDDLLEAITEGKNTAPSMHIVLQSGSNVVLKRMNRKYTRQMFLDAVDRLKQKNPDFTFTTDVIVGFPGETEEDFLETCQLIEEIKFAKVHMFPYSPRPRTRAASYPDQVDSQTANRRKQHLLRLSEKVAFELRAPYVGRVMEVLTESENQGHTDNFLPVKIKGGYIPSNTLCRVEILENRADGLLGRLIVD